ncbi:uncharacterized protein LOC131237302 [Magnolia sinica]|uniref:uncharacterized protein LOC131237302 n=1 Tax=Magnolia sinica TaxID=86752 RepID=UPI002659D546|nr:uncharacterized protein LOC131237302 [Magnolia sinica]
MLGHINLCLAKVDNHEMIVITKQPSKSERSSTQKVNDYKLGPIDKKKKRGYRACPNTQEACSDVAPLMKKPKGSCSPQDGNEEPTHPPENLELPPVVEEMCDAVDDPVHGSNDEAVDAAKDEEMDTVKELAEEPNEPVVQNASDVTVEELSEKPRETTEMFDGRLQVSEANDDPQQSTGEVESEREEGELVPDGA